MRILHVPYNIASLPSHTVRGLLDAGVKVTGLIVSNHPIQTAEGLKVIAVNPKNSLQKRISKLRWFTHFINETSKVDLIHWYYGASVIPGSLDLAWIRAVKKPALIEWMGSDIRIPEIEYEDNPFYKQAYISGYEYAGKESNQNSRRTQRKFAKAGFANAADRGMFQYIQKDIFPHTYHLPRRLILKDYEPRIPSLNTRRPIIVHSPSAPIAKGSPSVLRTIEHLHSLVDFEFRLVQGMPRTEALATIQSADLFLDQFVLGDYGMSALEAMAFGKPVICYIKPTLAKIYGSELPIVKSTQEQLTQTLLYLLHNPEKRQEIGAHSRRYVEKYADIASIIPRLIDIYEDVLRKSGMQSV